MGAGQSKSAEDKVFYNEIPIQLSPDLVNHLADKTVSPDVTARHQTTLDAHIRSQIQMEIQRLMEEEESVRREIEEALAKENLDKERSMAGESSADEADIGAVKSSASLLNDIDEVQRKVDHYSKARRQFDSDPAKKVVSCYKENPTTPLNCRREVHEFMAFVSQAEQDYLKSLH